MVTLLILTDFKHKHNPSLRENLTKFGANKFNKYEYSGKFIVHRRSRVDQG